MKENEGSDMMQLAKPSPIDSCSLISYATASWVMPLLRLGVKQPLQLSDVYDLPAGMRAAPMGARFSAAYAKQQGRHRILKALFKTSGRNFWLAACFVPVSLVSQSVLPIVLKQLIRFLNNEPGYLKKPFLGIESGWVLAAILCICALGSTVGMNGMFLNLTFFSSNNRTALMEVLYRKVLQLSESSLQQSSMGQIVTLASADLERVFFGGMQGILLINAPVLVIVCLFLLVLEIGVVPTMAGFSVVILLLPANVLVARRLGSRKRRMLELTDARIRFMTDILRGIRLVKLYGWEESAAKHIQGLRVNEVRENAICMQLMAFTQTTGFILPALIPFFMFLTYVAMGEPMEIEKVFAVLALMNTIRMPMQMLPRSVNAVTQALVSVRRIEIFLNIPEREHGCKILEDGESSLDRNDVELHMLSSTWGGEAERKAMLELARTAPKGKGKGKNGGKGLEKGKGDGKAGKDHAAEGTAKSQGKGTAQAKSPTAAEEETAGKSSAQQQKPAAETKLALSDITLGIPHGQKVAIVGRVASGKSSLLQSILGELEVKNGQTTRRGLGVPFCSQSPWIQSATLKENILFGQQFDEDLYRQAVKAAQLGPDLQILQDGDETSIGENGINLSGGQKARVALARAFYTSLKSHAPLILLDDPLAAVDAFVAHSLFYEGFLGVLKDQTVVLTLNAHLDLLTSFDRVIALEEGAVIADGSLTDVMAVMPWIQEAVGSTTKDSTEQQKVLKAPVDSGEKPQKQDSASANAKASGKEKKDVDDAPRPLYEPEDRATGRVQLRNYIEWAHCAVTNGSTGTFAGSCLLFMIGLLFLSCQALRITLDFWVARWAESDMKTGFAAGVYGAIAGAFVMGVFLRACVFLFAAMRSSRALHQRVLDKVLGAPINLFFDVTQTGSILNRFSGDLDKVDDKLPEQFYMFLNLLTTIVWALTVCLVSSPFVICGFPFIAYIFLSIVAFYQKSARELKRLDALSRSPVLQHFSESIRGLVTLRAFDAVPRFVEAYDGRVDTHAKVFFTFWICSRWLAMRVDLCAIALQTLVALVSIAWKDHISPVMVGLALVWGFQLSGLLQFCVRSFAEVENTMTGVERLVAYKHVPQEAERVIEPRPSKSWPGGEIEFRGLCVRYRPNLPLVLKDVSFRVQPGEHVGICGRTGSGKSTICLAMFRILECDSGEILIDGRDSRSIGLSDLRQRLAIIPQDPILFRMSVRENMDPFGMYSDDTIWKCLQLVRMDTAVRALNGELSFLCAEGGTNFSLGQMQLLCIARALLREPGIVMLDEATANVDAASDEVIQSTIRSQFKSATVMTIAHRLSTIADSTKIAVFDKGELCEFGTPRDLVERGGMLAAFFSEAGIELPGVSSSDVDLNLQSI
jgi:ABC-type multidrug transport system fused ATPase/permease subunit